MLIKTENDEKTWLAKFLGSHNIFGGFTVKTFGLAWRLVGFTASTKFFSSAAWQLGFGAYMSFKIQDGRKASLWTGPVPGKGGKCGSLVVMGLSKG